MSIRSSDSPHGAEEIPRFAQAADESIDGPTGHPGRKRLLSRAGEDAQGPRHRIGAGCGGRSQGSEQVVEPQIPLSSRARLGDEIGALAKVLSMTDQLERTEGLGRRELEAGIPVW